jgi:hypothetical protein
VKFREFIKFSGFILTIFESTKRKIEKIIDFIKGVIFIFFSSSLEEEECKNFIVFSFF